MVSIPLHNEMAYLPDPPDRVYLHCQQPAAKGGQTPVADGRRVLAALDPDFAARLRERGVRHIRNLTPEPGRISPPTGWRKAFACQTPAQAEAAARSAGFDVAWFDDVLQIAALTKFTITHPDTQSLVASNGDATIC